MRLATLDDAKVHLHVSDPAREPEIALLLDLASAQVFDFIGTRADPSWTEDTAPLVVQAATLTCLGYRWEHRGDDSDDAPLWLALQQLLMRTRDPVVA